MEYLASIFFSQGTPSHIHYFQMVAKNRLKNDINYLPTPLDSIGVIPTEADFTSPVDESDELVEVLPNLYFKLDCFHCTFPTKYFNKVRKYLLILLGGGEFNFDATVRHFEQGWRHPSGAVMAIGHMRETGLYEREIAYLDLSGSVLSQIKMTRFQKFIRILLKKYEPHPSLVDLAIDDYNKTIDLDYVEQLCHDWQYVGFGNTFKVFHDGRKKSKGHTIQLGNRGKQGGGKRLKIYDKSKESKGVIDAIRLELSLSQHYAVDFFKQLCVVPVDSWHELWGASFNGSVDFIKRRGEEDKNPGRRERYGWWDLIVGDYAKFKPTREYKEQTIERMVNWFYKQVAPSLAVLMWIMSDEEFWVFFWHLVFEGESRFKEKHHWLIQSSLFNKEFVNSG